MLYDATGSAGWVAVSAVARMLGYVFLSPFGGVVADRFDRRRLLVSLDLFRAVVMVALAFVAWTDGSPVLAIALAVVATAATVPYRPACVAATVAGGRGRPRRCQRRREHRRTDLVLAGPALGSLVVAVTDPGTAFGPTASRSSSRRCW